ncbi:MAG: RNA-binding protein [bacterium]|nr:RNA-binding protein [bacterium]
MTKKLFVGGLSYETTEATLKELFAQAGTVESATVIVDKLSGRSKGFGFVEMSSEEESQKAVEMFNGKEIDGRKVTVNEARPLEARPPRREGGFGRDRGGYGGGGGGGRDRW